MSSSIYFDDALPTFAALVQKEWGESALVNNIFLRDVTGKLTFVVLDPQYGIDARSLLMSKLLESLKNYINDDGFSVATADELFDDRLKDTEKALNIELKTKIFKGKVLLIDRRIIGADWLRTIPASSMPPLRVVFSSIKGGVGRSTALCVVAAHLASKGRRVLAVDMDIEAPGLGNMLLPEKTLPKYGLLDYLVEQGLGELDDQFYADMVGSSWLGGKQGRVDVIPAIGQRSLDEPANVIAKIARAYLDGGYTGDQSEPTSFMDHMRALIDRFGDPLRYDVVLIDARAGLHETTATAISGLGAKVLFFGIDQPQTFAGYELLFAHLATLKRENEDDWRGRINFIQAKAPEHLEKRSLFSESMEALINKYLIQDFVIDSTSAEIESLKDIFDVEWIKDSNLDYLLEDIDKADIKNNILEFVAIPNDSRFVSFDPTSDRDSLLERTYQATFGDLLDKIDEMMEDSLEAEMSK